MKKIDLSPLNYKGRNYQEDMFYMIEKKINEIVDALNEEDKEFGIPFGEKCDTVMD